MRVAPIATALFRDCQGNWLMPLFDTLRGLNAVWLEVRTAPVDQ
jgi:hypothetical protein